MSKEVFESRASRFGIVFGALYGLLARLAAANDAFAGRFAGTFVGMSVAFLFIVPLVIGFLAVRPVANPSWSFRLFGPWAAILLGTLAAMLIGWEGAICVVFGLPIMLVMASIGGLIGGAGASRNRVVGAIIVALPWLLAPLEGRVPLRDEVRVVRTAIEIAAPPEVVWREIVTVPTIGRDELRPALYTSIGFPRPVSAVLNGSGVGAEREARFERGLVFRERVTEWQTDHRLSFTIAAMTDRIPPTTLDRHVTVGGAYFDALSGTYEIEPLAGGGVRLHLSSEHRLSTHFNLYARAWSDAVMRSIQDNILAVIKRRSESSIVDRAA